MSHRTRTRLIGLAALTAGVLMFWAARRIFPGGSQGRPRSSADLVEAVTRLIRANYVEEPDGVKIMQGGYQGLVSSLDAMSSYLDPAAVRKYADSGLARFKDAGLILFKRSTAFPVVVGVIDGSPAAQAGFKAGDLVSALDDRSIVLWGLSEIRLYTKDPEARPLKVRRVRGASAEDIKIVRADIYPRSATLTEARGTAGILAVHHFHPPLVDEIRRDLLRKIAGRPGPLILDFRRAFEGTNEEAARFLNLFVQAAEAGFFERKAGEKTPLACPNPAPLAGAPLIVWIDQATMGPAEIAAAALRRLRQAKIIGLPTAGLTSQQEFFPLTGGDALLLTTGIYALSAEEKIWMKGVAPDIKIEGAPQDQKAYWDKTLPLLAQRP